jgi:3-phenylpropionate/cinnamic acid dioxygenase small subunit
MAQAVPRSLPLQGDDGGECANGLEAGLIYADTRGMLEDRISSLRKVNIYERQRYRHIVGLPVVLGRGRMARPMSRRRS